MNAALVVILLTGCTTTVKLGSFEEFQKRNGDRTVLVRFKNGEAILGKNSQIETDSLRIIVAVNNSALSAPIRELQSIENVDHVKGAISGFTIGLLGGVFMGLCITSTFDAHVYRADYSLVDGALLGGAMGAAGGAILGAIIGSRTVYQFPPDTAKTVQRKPQKPGK